MKVIGGIIICEVLQLYGLVIIVILFGTNLKYFCVLFFHHWSSSLKNLLYILLLLKHKSH